jgi:hypothetical protein
MEKKMEIITNIYPYKISNDKVTIGDVTIDVVNNMLSPFQQVDMFLSNLFADTDNNNITNNINTGKKDENKKEYSETDKVNLYTPYKKKQTITSYVTNIKTGGKSKSKSKSKKMRQTKHRKPKLNIPLK